MIAKTAPSCQRLKPNNPSPARSPPRAMAARAQGTRRLHRVGGNGEAATIVERRAAATDEACGRSDPTAPLPSAAGPQNRARGAWIGNAAWPAARVAGPRRNARARRARNTMRDQDQRIEIPRFRVRKTGDNRGKQEITGTIGRIRKYLRHRRGFGTSETGMSPGSSSRKGGWTQAGPIRSPLGGPLGIRRDRY